MSDRSFFTDGRPYLNSRQAAEYCGFEPDPEKADRQMKSFSSWCWKEKVKPLPGRRVYARADLEKAMHRGQVPSYDKPGNAEPGTPAPSTEYQAGYDEEEIRARAHVVANRLAVGEPPGYPENSPVMIYARKVLEEDRERAKLPGKGRGVRRMY